MRVSLVRDVDCFDKKVRTKNDVSFKTYNPFAANRIERELAKKGIQCHTAGNDFVAECFQKTVAVFEKLFGKNYLPTKLDFSKLEKNVYGTYLNISNKVTLNNDYNYGCFYNLNNLKAEAKKNYNPILPSNSSSGHPAHIFVHEFSHAAHWNHLEQRNGYYKASKVWSGLDGTSVPTSIGKLIAKFKLSRYAVESKDMCEFLAERMSQDICEGLSDNAWILCKDVDVDYSNIFRKNWNYRYTTPQSYLDYFTQQVWDGDIDEAKRTGDMVEEYLSELDAEKVHPAIAVQQESPLFSGIANIFAKISEHITDYLDDNNKLKLNR